MLNEKRIVAIIQARMGSSRLPGKVLLPLAGRPAILQMVDRVRRAKCVDEIVVAIPEGIENLPLARQLVFNHVTFYEGNENDVLQRVIDCAQWAKADIVVDLTGDCPLVDPEHIDALAVQAAGIGLYAHNCCGVREWPDGFDVQVYPRGLLEWVSKFDTVIHEHSGWNIWNHLRPKVKEGDQLPGDGNDFIPPWQLSSPNPEWGELAMTLDEQSDYEVISLIFQAMLVADEPFWYAPEIIKYYLDNELWKINGSVQRRLPGVK